MPRNPTWKQRAKNWLVPRWSQTPRVLALLPGMYHYQRERDGEYLRFHLRVESGGEALLIAGASEVARLSRAGAEAAKRLLDANRPEDVIRSLKHPGQRKLYDEVESLLDEMGGPSSRFPIFNLPDPIDSTRDARLVAPLQADVELGEMDVLRSILRRLWDAGIPHVRLLHQSSVGTQQLVQAVEHAEDIGMIAGVRALAEWLDGDERVKQLAAVGLDYVICPWGVTSELHREFYGQADRAALPNVFEQIRKWEMTPVIEVPLVAGTMGALFDSLRDLTEWRITHLECFALVADGERLAGESPAAPLAPAELKQAAAMIEELPDEHPLQAIWLPPQVSHAGESIRDKLLQGPRAGGDVTIRVDCNGNVLPPRGPNAFAGNLLTESWEQIWNDAAFLRFREQVESNTRCDQCPGLAICAADCPSDPIGWADDGRGVQQP